MSLWKNGDDCKIVCGNRAINIQGVNFKDYKRMPSRCLILCICMYVCMYVCARVYINICISLCLLNIYLSGVCDWDQVSQETLDRYYVPANVEQCLSCMSVYREEFGYVRRPWSSGSHSCYTSLSNPGYCSFCSRNANDEENLWREALQPPDWW